jgi:hypothetical protein
MKRYVQEPPAAFDPETIEILSDALNEAWRRVESSSIAADAREALAKIIVELAKDGEGDRRRLIDGALLRFKR